MVTNDKYYDDWAEIYDSIYSYVEEDIPFFVEEAINYGGPILELGCGTGRVTIPIAKAGINITGLDISKKMLEKTSSKIKALKLDEPEINLIHADMRNFKLNEIFSQIIIPFRGFQCLLTVEDQISTLINIKKHLNSKSRLIITLFVPSIYQMIRDEDVLYHYRDVIDPVNKSKNIIWNKNVFDQYNQIVNTRIIVDKIDNGYEVNNRIYRDFDLRYIYRWEMHHLLELCGFEILELYGDFDHSQYNESSLEMIWIVKNRE